MSQTSLRVFIAPLKSSRHHTPATFFRQCRAQSISTPPPSNSIITPTSRPQLLLQKFRPTRNNRPFSTTTPFRATVVKQNPRADDDGNDMTIEISEKAAKRLRQITTTPQKRNSLASSSAPESHLRVTVTSGGCHGFQYLMSLEPAEKIDPEEDTIFASGEDAGDGHAEVVMDSASLELLKGSTIDYTTELIGSQFKIMGNPRAKSSCGCGTSFDIE